MKLSKGQRALVTGASRGLGLEIAQQLAARGLDLILTARSAGALAAEASVLSQKTGRSISSIAIDLSSPDAALELARRCESLGGVDLLVNNAGVESTLGFDERSPSEIIAMLAVNLTAPILLSRALLPGMLARGRGHVVNIASVGGVIALPFNEPYSATKFGLIGFTRALRLTARASSWPVSASAVCPGFIEGAGLFEDLKRKHGVTGEGLGARPLAEVGAAVVRAVEEDLSEVFVTGGDIRQAAAMSLLHPEAAELGALDAPSTRMFKAIAAARAAAREGAGEAFFPQ